MVVPKAAKSDLMSLDVTRTNICDRPLVISSHDNVYVNYGKRLHLQTTNSVRDENPGVHSQGLRELAVTNWN